MTRPVHAERATRSAESDYPPVADRSAPSADSPTSCVNSVSASADRQVSRRRSNSHLHLDVGQQLDGVIHRLLRGWSRPPASAAIGRRGSRRGVASGGGNAAFESSTPIADTSHPRVASPAPLISPETFGTSPAMLRIRVGTIQRPSSSRSSPSAAVNSACAFFTVVASGRLPESNELTEKPD